TRPCLSNNQERAAPHRVRRPAVEIPQRCALLEIEQGTPRALSNSPAKSGIAPQRTRVSMDLSLHRLQTENETLRRENERLRALVERHDLTQVAQTRMQLDALFRAFSDMLFLFDAENRYLDYKADDHNGLFVSPEDFMGKRVEDTLPEPARQS